MTGREILFALCLGACAMPQVGTATALIAGISFSLILGNPWPAKTARLSKVILQISVVGLGFGLSLGEVLHTGKDSLVFSVVGIAATLLIGHLLGKLFRNDGNTSALISFGTAICGGSAIAAMAPVLKAENDEIAVSLATVFTLNAVALLLFPLVGHTLNLSQELFGTWAGLAIHDTSSVVGATTAYGQRALAVGTTVKLTRAIWITPVVITFAWFRKSGQRTTVPLFIVGFVLAAAVRTVAPQWGTIWTGITAVARQSLVVTLFLIGAGLSRTVLRNLGLRPLLQGITLWLVISSASLAALVCWGLR